MNALSQIFSIISMNVNKTELPATKGFTIVHCRLWNIVHGSNLKWNRCIPHRFTSSRDCLQYVSPSLKHLMRKTDRLHARKDPRYKTIKHEVRKKLCVAYWQYLEKIITDFIDSIGANAAGKATVLNSYLQSVFTSHVPLDFKQRINVSSH